MAYALIDNATLTSVERVLGNITCNNLDTVNGDLVAFENLIQAILFYDDLVCIDNYKEQYRQSRIDKFDYIRFLSSNNFELDEIEKAAKNETKFIKPEIRGGEFADTDFRTLIEMLRLNMICTWDMRSSIYYLTMKMLGQPNTNEYEKYSRLTATIFNELSDVEKTRGHWSKEIILVSSNGHIHTKQEFQQQTNALGGVTHSLEMFIASLNWLAFKSIYYSLAAKYLSADTFIHPIRHAFQLYWMKKTGCFGYDFTSKLISNLSEKISTASSEIIDYGRIATVSLDIPIFSVWLAQRSGGIKNVLKTAIELRDNNQFTIARETMKEIKIAYDEYGIAKGNRKAKKLLRDLDKISGDLKRSYGVSSAQGIQGSFLIKTVNSLTSCAGIPPLPEYKFTLSTPDFLKNNRVKAFSTIFKDITNELTSMERLGGYHDILTSDFVINDEQYARPKTEDPKFRHIQSYWKIPM